MIPPRRNYSLQNALRLSLLIFFGLTFSPCVALCSEPPTPAIEIVVEPDAYYSNVGFFVPLTDDPVPDLNVTNEIDIYRQLLLTSWPPRFFLLELSVDPLPILGVYLKKNHRHHYDKGKFGDSNVIESLTAGFQEPYALTFFFGNVVTLIRPGEERKSTNKGYQGWMFSVGDQHIKDNELINDKWLQVEWKLKGDREFANVIHRWSFRVGSTLHENQGIEDSAYIGMRRNNLDFDSPVFALLPNSNINLQSDFSLNDGRFIRQEVTIGKKYPLKNYDLGLSLDLGFIWESSARYSPRYRDPNDSRFTVILRPNIEF